MPQTDFLPQLHGFDFKNSWDTDDNYRDFIKQKLLDAVPIVAEIIVTNPLFGGALLGALGSAYGIGEALLPGIFDTIIIPGIINEIVNEVNDNVKDFIPDSYGACGGMAYASLDYYYNQWIIPKGVYKHPDDVSLDVPPNNIPDAKILRDYIYDRLKDTYDAGGVLNKMLEWYIILKTLPPQIGGGGIELQKRTKIEWQKLTALLDEGKPQPLALVFDVWDIFDNHQLVAYGYSGDPTTGGGYINVYDNNNPNKEMVVSFVFTNPEMNGDLMNFVFPDGVVRLPGVNRTGLKGFFCIDYTPKTPPISWGLQAGLVVNPAGAQSIGTTFDLQGTLQNAFTFFQQWVPNQVGSIPVNYIVTPLVADAGNYNVEPSISNPGEALAHQNIPLPFETTVSFRRPGSYIMFTKVRLTMQIDANAYPLAEDNLQRIFYVPVLGGGAVSNLLLQILPPLNIEPYNPDDIPCYYPYVERSNLTLIVFGNPFSSDPVTYQWSVNNIVIGGNTQKLEIFDLPGAGTQFTVKVTITHDKDESQASGALDITTYSEDEASRLTGSCNFFRRLWQILLPPFNPALSNPFGPDDRRFREYVQENLGQIESNAKQLTQLAKEGRKYID